MLNITLPNKIKIITINNNIIILDAKNICNIFNIHNFFFLKEVNTLVIKNKLYYDKNSIINDLNKFFFFWNFLIINKITFQGKGYKIKIKSKSFELALNKANNEVLKKKGVVIKKIHKYKFLIIFNSNYNNIIYKILNLRYISVFTKRGLRLNRQNILKKIGKKNTN